MIKNERGFHASFVLIAVAVLVVVGLVGWRVLSRSASENDNVQSGAVVSDELILHNLGLLRLDSVDITTQATRDFATNGLKGFYAFGDSLSGGRINPNFEFASLKSDAQVVSSIDGVVSFVREQSPGDYEVFIQPNAKSQWTIGYDHVTDLQVKKDQTIQVGAVIGRPAKQNNGLTRFEIQINKGFDDDTVHVCPSTLLAADIKDSTLAALAAMQDNWEKTTGLELYDLSRQEPVGCLGRTTLTPSQAEGR